MGEIADMMLDGTLCECCGCYIEGEGYGVPRYCSPQCARDRGMDYKPKLDAPRKVACPTCGRRVKEVGLRDHMRDAHQTDSSR